MKRILASLVKHLRRFAAHPSGNDTESISPPASAAFAGGNDGSASRAAISSTSLSPGILRQPGIIQPPQRMPQSNDGKDARPFHPEFTTRQELQRELELLRRLIESRK
jgi:hypothetical protein